MAGTLMTGSYRPKAVFAMGSFRPIKVTVGSGGTSFTVVVGRLIRNLGSIFQHSRYYPRRCRTPTRGVLYASFLIHCLAVVGIELCEH